MTADHSDEPTVPVRDLRALMQSFSESGESNVQKATEDAGFYDGIAVGRMRSAHELEELVAEYE